MKESTSYLSELTGVFGYPVAENPTIVMQEAAFKAMGLNWRYLNLEVHARDLADAVRGMRAMNFKGINLTIPHKVAILKYLDEIAPDAALIGAVNTVRRVDDRLIGENTDGKGFLRALQEDAGIDPAGEEVVILGAGGAARAIGVELALAGVSAITIVNRSIDRGQELADHLNAKTAVQATFIPWEYDFAVPPQTGILINATSIGLFPDIDARPALDYDTIGAGMLICDVIPNPPHTPFLREAEARGARTLDGLGMLVYQGAIGFTMWTGEEAPVDVMHQALSAVFS
ncbi:MAG: shikimate dehydrogenase [Candidatus Promineifilaceae bacterium]